VERARVVLEALETGEREGGARAAALIDDLPLFSAAARTPAPAAQPPASAVEARLEGVFPDELTPREALALVYELKGLLARGA
jgi:DNA mismatch repair protein MutS